MIVGSHDLEK